ncbi:MAG TPA: glycosyltransferase [Aggregatilineales bacterium]|nr:glycosyltransferase [Chloroflexota bacterium]HPV05764.1 glycosyltransferase [Aggregatilineales bacterium]HQA67443.1 glycosyltransferase [Aggregatilineales bacterium]HQE17721.1 glycosyltransferase [Aggregatilineales bacterium]
MSNNRAPIRILFTIPNFITAGSGQAMWNVVSRLNPDLFSPAICVLKRGGALEAEIEAAGVSILELPFIVPARPLHRLPAAVIRAARRFRPHGFHIWHSYHYGSDYTEPIIARLAGARAWVYTKKNMSWGDRAWHVRTALASRIAAQNTAMLTRFFAAPRVQRKVRMVPRGVDVKKFRPGTPPRLGLREKLGLSASDIVVGCVAHLLPVKGQNILLQAAAKLDGVHLVLAGKRLDESYASALDALCSSLGIADRVHFLGQVNDIAAFHAELDIFVLPTLARFRMEGCPVALLEAMASGLPCIATDIPGSQDIIEAGKSGILVPAEDPSALARALQQLIADPGRRQALGAAARRRIVECYTIEQEVARHEALYLEVLNNSSVVLSGSDLGRG